MNSEIDLYSLRAYRVFMSSDPRKLEELAAALDPKERARLALHLIESLDPGTDEDTEELWLEEAEKRLARFDAGDTEARPANDVLSEIRNKIG